MLIEVGTKSTGVLWAEVDADDYETVKALRWRAIRRRKAFYVRAIVAGEQILLHRFVMSAERGDTVDHIDGNPLNNTKANLRICTLAENTRFAHDRGAYGSPSHVHAVKKTLADGSVKTYIYDRRGHASRTKSEQIR